MKTVELHFPKLGITRRLAERKTDRRGEYGCPWAVNVRLNDPFEKRLRGGSRPGLTKFTASSYGTTIEDMVSIDVASTSGTDSLLFVLSDSGILTGDAVTLVGYLLDDSGNFLTDDSGNRLLISSVAVPTAGFLVAGNQQVYAIGASAINQIDPKTGQVDDLVATGGTVPLNQTFGATYRDRLCLSGEDNVIHVSKQGDFSNWDYGRDVTDSGRAVVFQLSLASEVGPLPTAMIPHKDGFLLLASARSLWVLQGDPTTGQLNRLSENVGIVDSKAWCKVEDTVYFLSDNGVYVVNADGSGLKPLSDETVPDELQDVDASTVTVLMGYEKDREAIHVYLKTAGGSDNHWIYELQSGAWWSVRLQDDHSPLAVVQHAGKLLLAGTDGYVRQVGGDDDDGTAIESHFIIGPMKLGSIDRRGIINKLHGILGQASGTVTWRLITEDTAEAAADSAKTAIELYQSGGDYSSYYSASDTWTAGRSNAQYPRITGGWGCLWIQSTAKYAFEGATMEIKLSGRLR